MSGWSGAGRGVAASFGNILPNLSGPNSVSLPSLPRLGPSLAPPTPAPSVAPEPTGLPGEGAIPPRTAFAERPPGNPRPQRFGRVSVVGACVLEAAVVVPTLHVEVMLAEEPWSLLLRILIALVRLYPIIMPCIPPLCRAVAECGTRFHHWSLCLRLAAFFNVLFTVLFCPEVRWGVAITLDMWYLLTTPLNQGLSEVPCVTLLVANIILCFVDTLTLIMMLAVKSTEDLEQAPEAEGYARPRPVKLGNSDEASATKFDPTCIICLSDFRPEDDILQLPCEHTFHTECITKWLSRSRHCPLRCPPVVLPPRITRTQMEAVPLTVEHVPSSSEPV